MIRLLLNSATLADSIKAWSSASPVCAMACDPVPTELPVDQGNAKSPASNDPAERGQYITRLPSSSLLANSLRAEPNALQYGSVDLITLKVNPDAETKVVRLLSEHMSRLPQSFSWFVAKSTEEEASWVLLETQLAASCSPSTPTTSASLDLTAPIVAAVKGTADKPVPNESGVRVIRQPSRFIETFRSSTPGGPNPLGDFLFQASPLNSSPPEMTRSRMVIPLVANKAANSQTVVPDSFKSYLGVVIETAKVKSDQQGAFVEACDAMQADFAKKEPEAGLVTIEVHQDLEASASGCLYTIIYYFNDEDAAKDCHQSEDWKAWRRQIGSLLGGPPRLQFCKGVFDSRVELRAIGGKSDKASRLALQESPSRVVAHVRDSFRKRLPSLSTEVPVKKMPNDGTGVAVKDPRFAPFTDYLQKQFLEYMNKKSAVLSLPVDGKTDLKSYATAATLHKHFGLHYASQHWKFLEWLPDIKDAFLMGDFNEWSRSSHPLVKQDAHLYGEDVWGITLDGKAMQHGMKYKLHIITLADQQIDRIPPSAAVVVQSKDEGQFWDAIVWNPPARHEFRHPPPKRPTSPKIYEAYVGLSSRQNSFGTYRSFQEDVLPRIYRLGYNTLLLVGLPQHTPTSVGWQVTNFFAPAHQCVESLKSLVDAAHGLGLYVMMSVIHSHASLSANVGLHQIDGTEGGFFRAGTSAKQSRWNSPVFDYSKPEVCRFLLSQLSYFHDVFLIDGFRFDGLTSMFYHHHGVGRDFKDYNDFGRYFSFETDQEACTYLMVASEFLHSLGKDVLAIGSDFSRMPLLNHEVADGGFGFDYRTAPHICDEWVRQLCHSDDDQIDMLELVSSMETRAPVEKTLAAAETLGSSLRSRRSLKVAMFAWESLHTHAVGGVAPHVTELAAGLARLGHEVHVFVRAVTALAQHSVHYGVHYHECPFQLNSDFVQEMQNMCNSFIGSLNATEEFMGQMFDICHSHDWLTAKATVRAKHQGHTCIQTMHSTEFGRCGNNMYGGESKRIADIEREGCHMADRIICVSGVLANEVSNLFSVHRQKIQVIYNGINACNFDGFENAAPIKAGVGVNAMDPMFLFVGRLVVQKGPDLLIEAVPMVLRFRADVKFVIVGDGHMKQSLVNRANQLGVSHACRFLGMKTGGELKSLFKACDAVVVPSRNEPFGIVVLEAWSAYKPVVATTCGGPRDFVSPNVDGVLVDPNSGSISWGCCEILKNFDHARWMGDRGRVKAAFNFSWDQIAKNTETVYYEQLNKHDSPDSEGGLGDCSLAFRLMGPAIHDQMGVFTANDAVTRGIALHKIIRLMVISLGGEAYLNFMGNEFGHPDFVDMPRGGNGYSAHHAVRRFELADDTLLKFKHLEFFDACMIRLESYCKWLGSSHQFVSTKNQGDKVVAFERGEFLFVFNLHPYQNFEDYQIGHSLGKELCVLFDTDETRFCGMGRLGRQAFPSCEPFNERAHSIKLYLPSRTAMVLASTTFDTRCLMADPIFVIQDVDAFISKLMI